MIIFIIPPSSARGVFYYSGQIVQRMNLWFKRILCAARDCTVFAFLYPIIGPEISRHPFNKSDANLKLNATWSVVFSRLSGRFLIFNLSSYSFLVMYHFLSVKARHGYFGFDFTILSPKARTLAMTTGITFNFLQVISFTF